jgi:hypothetical protein
MKVDSNKRKVSEEKDTPKMKKKVILMLNALWIDRHFGTSLWESLRKHHAKTLPHGNWTDRVLPYAMWGANDQSICIWLWRVEVTGKSGAGSFPFTFVNTLSSFQTFRLEMMMPSLSLPEATIDW